MTSTMDSAGTPADAVKTLTDPGSSSKDTSIFGGLPTELLAHIFASVAGDLKYSTLYSLALINRHFNSMAIPILYREYTDCCDSHLVSFAKILIKTPALAEFVQELTSRVWAFKPAEDSSCRARVQPGSKVDYGPIVDVTLAMLRDFGSNSLWFFENYQRTFLESYDHDDKHEIVLFCLATLCPNLMVMGIVTGRCFFDYYVALDEMQMDPLPHLFQNVRTITVDKYGCGAPNTCTSNLFMLPSIRKLTIDSEHFNLDEYDHNPPWKCPPRISPITELIITNGNHPSKFLAQVIRSCKSLTVFHYELLDFDDDRESIHDCGMKDVRMKRNLLDALDQHKSSLEDLRWSCLGICKSHSRQQRIDKGTLPLAEYTSLTRLEFPLHLLAHDIGIAMVSEVLPPGLESVKFDVRSIRDGFTDPFFVALFNATSDYLTNLSRVEVQCRTDVDDKVALLPLRPCHVGRMFASRDILFDYSLEFAGCEMKPGWMDVILQTISKQFGEEDGRAIVDHTSKQCGCRGCCESEWRHRRFWGDLPEEDGDEDDEVVILDYMGPWVGPDEFDSVK